MTVKELIKLLDQYPQETRVVVAGYEGGYNDILKVSPIRVQIDARTEWWYGQHEKAENGSGEAAILIEGKNMIASS